MGKVVTRMDILQLGWTPYVDYTTLYKHNPLSNLHFYNTLSHLDYKNKQNKRNYFPLLATPHSVVYRAGLEGNLHWLLTLPSPPLPFYTSYKASQRKSTIKAKEYYRLSS